MGANADAPRIVEFGDAALLVVYGDTVDPVLSARAQALAWAVEVDRAGGSTPWGQPVPAYASVLVPFDLMASDAAEAVDLLRGLVEQAGGSAPAVEIEADATAEGGLEPLVIDVRYGGDDGPDLDDVARLTGLTVDEVITEHTMGRYRVYFLGFSPGFAYLGPLTPKLRLPRRPTPRTRVPAGSVAIAGGQTAVYPLPTPGGWHLIGRTEAPLWQPDRDPPALLRAGQEVSFRRVPGDVPLTRRSDVS